MSGLDPAAAVSDLGFQSLDLEPGDVIEGGIVILKIANANEDGSTMHRAISPGLSHWEALGMLTDALDGMRFIGMQAEED